MRMRQNHVDKIIGVVHTALPMGLKDMLYKDALAKGLPVAELVRNILAAHYGVKLYKIESKTEMGTRLALAGHTNQQIVKEVSEAFPHDTNIHAAFASACRMAAKLINPSVLTDRQAREAQNGKA